MRAEQFTESIAYHGEGPIWDAHRGKVLWVDIHAGDVLVTDPDTASTERLHVSSVAACVVPRVGGGFAVMTQRGVALIDSDNQIVETLPELWDDPGIRMNDGGCDPAGRFFCGTMAYDVTPGAGSLFRVDPDRSVHTILTGVTISNGLAWTPDGSTVFYVDSPTRRVDAFDYDLDAGTLGERRTVVEIADGAGGPDGITLDSEGGIWVALWGGSAVHRYAQSGELTEIVDLPVPQVSSCAFGGPELTDLYISTSWEHLDRADAGAAGALFRVRPGVTGLPTLPYSG